MSDPSPTTRIWPCRLTFDPFIINPDHGEHITSKRIIRLEESDKVFCPICLEKGCASQIHKLNDQQFDHYIKSLFQALDQYSQKRQITKIFLPILEIVLRIKPPQIRDDNEFHDLLRTVYKMVNVVKTDLVDFYLLTSIYCRIVDKYNYDNPMPLWILWRTSQLIMENSKKHISQIEINNNNQEDILFIKGITLTVKLYLSIVAKFSSVQVSVVMFQIGENDQPLLDSKDLYLASQVECLKFTQCVLLPKCWANIYAGERKLSDDELDYVSELIACIRQCCSASLRLDNQEFISYLIDRDFFNLGYLLIHRNPDVKLRSQVRSSLALLVFNKIRSDYESDITLESYFPFPNYVEVNHRNAITYSRDPTKNRRTMFYLLINYVALKYRSSYFNSTRVGKVLKSINPNQIRVNDSIIFNKVYNFLVASVAKRLGSFDNVENYFRQTWNRLKDRPNTSKINDEFCFDPKVFFWASECPDFSFLARESTIKELLISSKRQNTLSSTLISIIKNKTYKRLLNTFLRTDESSLSIFEHLLKTDEGKMKCNSNNQDHVYLMNEFSGIIPSLLNYSVLQFLNGANEQSSRERICRLTSLIIVSVDSCSHFNVLLDNQYLIDLFRLIETLFHHSENASSDDILLLLTQMLTQLLNSPNPSLMNIIKHLNHSVLGLMYQHLADYTLQDRLGEEIAHLMVVYDELDYPLSHRIEKDLANMSCSILNWMLSKDEHLHKLSLRVARKLSSGSIENRLVVTISLGMAHMLMNNTSLLKDLENKKLFLEVSKLVRLTDNPLMDTVFRHADEQTIKVLENIQPAVRACSPALSFVSTSSIFEDEQVSISNILDRLNEGDGLRKHEDVCGIPTSLYATESVPEQYANPPNLCEWEQSAHDASKIINVLKPSIPPTNKNDNCQTNRHY